MNSKSIQINHNTHSNFDIEILQPASISRKLFKALSGFLFRSELEKAQAGYRAKQQRRLPQPTTFGNLSTEEKLRHGMYRWMD